jgi:hypothetical protein
MKQARSSRGFGRLERGEEDDEKILRMQDEDHCEGAAFGQRKKSISVTASFQRHQWQRQGPSQRSALSTLLSADLGRVDLIL